MSTDIKVMIEAAKRERESRRERLVVHREKLAHSIKEMDELHKILISNKSFEPLIEGDLTIERLFPSLFNEKFKSDDYLVEYEMYEKLYNSLMTSIEQQEAKAVKIIEDYLNENK